MIQVPSTKLLHEFFNITSKTQLCSNFRCQLLKEQSISPDDGNATLRDAQMLQVTPTCGTYKTVKALAFR